MFLAKTGCTPPWARKSPLAISLSRNSFGSNWICMGADTASAAPLTATATENVPGTLVSIRSGMKRMLALPGAGAFAAGGGAGALAGGAVAGGAVGGGAVAGGAVAGGGMAGAAAGGAGFAGVAGFGAGAS